MTRKQTAIFTLLALLPLLYVLSIIPCNIGRHYFTTYR